MKTGIFYDDYDDDNDGDYDDDDHNQFSLCVNTKLGRLMVDWLALLTS
jgi:hypothetical protein